MDIPEQQQDRRRPFRRSAFPLENNFDLLRLVAALQVVYFHVQFHLKPRLGAAGTTMRIVFGPLTGVPIFFIISGFLVSASFERRPDYRVYARNRIVRIYPALWVCLAVTILILGVEGYLAPVVLAPRFAAWLIAQVTIGQSLHLAAFRGFGTGIPNGSLWTISVEVLFYLTIPVIYYILVDRTSAAIENALLIALAVASFILATALLRIDPESHQSVSKLLNLTPAPYLYMFLIGLLCQRNFHHLGRWIIGKGVWWIAAYYTLVSIMRTHTCTVALGWCPRQTSATDAVMLLSSQLVLGGLICGLAFSARSLSARLLRGNDVSYGTYLFHMLIVNLAVNAGLTGHAWLVPLVLAASIGVGWLSWQAVERPALRQWKSGSRPKSRSPDRAFE